MARNGVTESKVTPPYIPLKTLFGFVEQLKNSTVPPRIDNTVLRGRSGADQTGIRSALRFLDLTDANDRVTDDLRTLVASFGTEEWKHALNELATKITLKLPMDSEHLESGTGGQLRDAFRDGFGVEGQMADKSIRFLLGLWDEAGTSYSPHFRKGGANSTRPRSASSRKRRPAPKSAEQSPDPPEPKLDPSMLSIPIMMPDESIARIVVPANLDEELWIYIDAQVRGLIKFRTKQAGKGE